MGSQEGWKPMTTLRAAFSYFAIVFAAGFLLGTLRALVVAPAFGELAAVALEAPVMLALSWWVCGLLIRRFAVSEAASARLTMGFVALALLLVGEAAISVFLAELTLNQHLSLYTTAPAQLGLAAQFLFAAFPYVRR